MGHVGLTPQTATALGGFKAQGKTAEAAAKLTEEALALQSVGCFAIVFEAIPSAVTEALMPRLEIPVIGIGAGPATDGQVLVLHDLLGVYEGHKPKFVKRYANVREETLKGLRAYADEVRARTFPDEDEHTYSIPPGGAGGVRPLPRGGEPGRHRHPLGLVEPPARRRTLGQDRNLPPLAVEPGGNSRAVWRRRISTPTTASAARMRMTST